MDPKVPHSLNTPLERMKSTSVPVVMSMPVVQICSLMGGSRWTVGVVVKGPFRCHTLSSLCCPFCSCVGVLALSTKGKQNEKWQQVVKVTWELHTDACMQAMSV